MVIVRHNCNLKKHISSVHKGKILKFEICPSKFTEKGSLKKHIVSVHEGRTMKCNICSNCYTRKISLKRHMESVLEIQDDVVRCFKL